MTIRLHWILVALFMSVSWGIAQDSAAVRLGEDPVRIHSLGMTLRLPEGTRAETVQYGESASTAIKLEGDLGLLLIKEQRTTNDDLDPAGVIRGIRGQLEDRLGYEVIGEQAGLRVGIWDGHRIYAQSARGAEGRAFRGITVFGHKERSFLIFDLSHAGDEASFARARRLYETIVATMDLEAMTSQTIQRSAALNATQALLDQTTLDDFDAIVTGRRGETWERLLTPGGTGDPMDDAEHGYRRVKSWSGYKGELTDKARDQWSEDERSLGYLISIDAMILERDVRIDSRSVFFVSLDGTQETWTIRMSLRRGGEQSVSSVTGARIGDDLTVTSTQGRQPPTVIKPEVPAEAFVSQFMTYHFGKLLIHKGLVGDFASYAYNSTTGAVSLRWDSVGRNSDRDEWVITTKLTPESPPSAARYALDGDLIRVTLASGRVWEPTDLETLLDLWKRKGLPLK